jgi:hypothetical protein
MPGELSKNVALPLVYKTRFVRLFAGTSRAGEDKFRLDASEYKNRSDPQSRELQSSIR